jgi:hypothetical protein
LACKINAKRRKPIPNTIRYPKSRNRPRDPNALEVPRPTFKMSKK